MARDGARNWARDEARMGEGWGRGEMGSEYIF